MRPTLRSRLHAFRPPLFLSVFAAIVFSTLSLLAVATDLFWNLPIFAGYLLYVCAAVFLFLAVWASVQSLKAASPKQKFLAAAKKHEFTAKMTQDYAYRTITFASVSLCFNVIFTLSKMLMGWYYSSNWLMVLSGYYIILCISRFLLVRYGKKQEMLTDETEVLLHEWKAYRSCGFMLLVMTIFLQGVVIMIVKDGMGFAYDEIVVIAIAAYDFYCLANAVIYMIVKRKNRSPLVNSIKSISFASSLVAMLSLQTAMFASFGGGSSGESERLMNILTGTGVCTLMIILGLLMMVRAGRELKRIHRFSM